MNSFITYKDKIDFLLSLGYSEDIKEYPAELLEELYREAQLKDVESF